MHLRSASTTSVLLAVLAACAPAQPPAEGFASDLEHFARELPARHKHPFFRVTEEEFRSAVAALERAVRGGAKVVLAVPCCQHELLGQLENETLRPLLRYGTLRERFVAEVTDAARARLLELAGYDVQVVEFVPLEHTPKNVLLRATRTERPARDRERLATEYRAFADALGIEPALERLLGDVVGTRSS